MILRSRLRVFAYYTNKITGKVKKDHSSPKIVLERSHLTGSQWFAMVTKVLDLSVFGHFLTTGAVEALKYFRAVHLIHKNGASRANPR